MTRRDEALAFLADWDPDVVELPDWVADHIDDDEAVSAAFDARFAPWDGAELALGVAPPARRRAPWRVWVGVGLMAATGLLFVGGGLVGVGATFSASAPEPDPALVLEPLDPVLVSEIPEPQPASSPEPVAVSDPEPDPEPSFEITAKIEELPVVALPGLSQGQISELKNRVARPQGERPLPSQPQLVQVTSSRIEIRERVHFPTGATEPGPASQALIDEIAQVMQEHPQIGTVAIEGHTDSRGTAAANQTLSELRATSVFRGLVERGVDPRRLSVVGHGETRPLDTNATSEGRARNSRVEFRIVGHEERAPEPVPVEPPSSEDYTDYGHHSFQRVDEDPLSTFSIDVDNGSYTLSRRKLREGYLPPRAAVRVEEFVNYLPYPYVPPAGSDPFGVDTELTPNPFNSRTHLLRIGVHGKRVAVDQRRSVHLTFLVDTSGSMQSNDKLDLAKYALRELTGELRDGDTVAIVAYAGSAGVVLPPTPMSRRDEVLSALSRMTAGGSTAMGAGIGLAYRLAEEAYREGAVNRVIIVSDGDANVGQTSHQALTEQIRSWANRGIGLTTAGFGMGNYKDTMMEQLANDGDGNYFYIDSEREARRVFVDRLTANMVVIARDVKLQVDFDPDVVEAYRLVGYENRDIADADFRDDRVDAGEIGAGHQVTALYELALREGATGQAATLRVRSKAPGPDAPASERSFPITTEAARPSFAEGSRAFRMAVSAASFAELLRGNPHLHGASFGDVARMARAAQRAEYAEDAELVELIETAARLSGE